MLNSRNRGKVSKNLEKEARSLNKKNRELVFIIEKIKDTSPNFEKTIRELPYLSDLTQQYISSAAQLPLHRPTEVPPLNALRKPGYPPLPHPIQLYPSVPKSGNVIFPGDPEHRTTGQRNMNQMKHQNMNAMNDLAHLAHIDEIMKSSQYLALLQAWYNHQIQDEILGKILYFECIITATINNLNITNDDLLVNKYTKS